MASIPHAGLGHHRERRDIQRYFRGSRFLIVAVWARSSSGPPLRAPTFEADCVHVRALLGAEKPREAPSTPPVPDAEQERKLPALGYVQ